MKMNLAVSCRMLLIFKKLTDAGDDFDEVDFAVPQEDDADGVTIDHTVDSEPFRRSSIPHQGNPLSKQSPSETDYAKLRSQQICNTAAPSVAVPQTPAPGESSASSNANCPNNQRPPPLPFPQQQCHSVPLKNAAQPPRSGAMQRQPGQPSIDQTSSLNLSNPSQHEPPAGFFTARAAETLQNTAQTPLKAPAFNPHLESPSIRKTAGIDHSKTKPVNRDLINAPSAIFSPQQQRVSNITNPQADRTRKVGMPGAPSPLQNRTSYKPPQMKRPVDIGASVRPALGDVTNASVNVPSADGSGDVKRQRIGLEGNRSEASIMNL